MQEKSRNVKIFERVRVNERVGNDVKTSVLTDLINMAQFIIIYSFINSLMLHTCPGRQKYNA